MTNEEFIQYWGEKAVKHYDKEKILPSLVITMGALEQGWGSGELAVNAHNQFSLNNYHDSVTNMYGSYLKNAPQERNRQITYSVEEFCLFTNDDQCLECYYKWLNRPNENYQMLHGCKDAMKTFDLIDASPYATDSKYGEKLKRIYNEYPLIAEYDRKAINIVKGCDEYLRVQIGSFIDFDRAVRYAKEASEKLKMSVCIKKYDEYHRVQIGAFTQKTNAESCRQRAVNAGYKTAYITSECGEDVYYQTYPA